MSITHGITIAFEVQLSIAVLHIVTPNSFTFSWTYLIIGCLPLIARTCSRCFSAPPSICCHLHPNRKRSNRWCSPKPILRCSSLWCASVAARLDSGHLLTRLCNGFWTRSSTVSVTRFLHFTSRKIQSKLAFAARSQWAFSCSEDALLPLPLLHPQAPSQSTKHRSNGHP